MALGRVRLRSVARVGFSIGWCVSLLPALIASALVAWVLHGIWGTLDGWTPWSPWAPDTRILGIALPTPEFRPREALHVDGIYRALAPIGHHPFIGGALGTLALTALGGLLFTLVALLAGLAYNLFARVTGGIEFELVPCGPARRARTPRIAERAATRRPGRRPADEDWLWEDEGDLRW